MNPTEDHKQISIQPLQSARQQGVLSCHDCLALNHAHQDEKQAKCYRCGHHLHSRKPSSVQKTTALLITAALFYIPSMIYPVSVVEYFGQKSPSTLIESIIFFWQEGAWPVALVIFIASVFVPLVKMFGLSFLLLSVHFKMNNFRRQRTTLYRIIEFIGRWSMVDVFVVVLLVCLVQMGVLAAILPGIGIVSFAMVVILTMIASESFDPRLIWDKDK